MSPTKTTKTVESESVTVEEAQAAIMGCVCPAASETVPLEQGLGRVLREEIRADRDFPPFDRVMMDGIALSFAAVERGSSTFTLQETQGAGKPRIALKGDSFCIEVMTGGVLPEGCDCVVPIERIERFAEIMAIRPGTPPARLQNVHRQGSDYPAGSVLVRSGTRMLAPHLAIGASVGKSSLQVAKLPAVAIVSTGDELVEVEAAPEPHRDPDVERPGHGLRPAERRLRGSLDGSPAGRP